MMTTETTTIEYGIKRKNMAPGGVSATRPVILTENNGFMSRHHAGGPTGYKVKTYKTLKGATARKERYDELYAASRLTSFLVEVFPIVDGVCEWGESK